jgi:vacuolar-type H+-ATPase subunit H
LEKERVEAALEVSDAKEDLAQRELLERKRKILKQEKLKILDGKGAVFSSAASKRNLMMKKSSLSKNTEHHLSTFELCLTRQELNHQESLIEQKNPRSLMASLGI